MVEAEKYALLAEDNRINLDERPPPPRGRIIDWFGEPMAAVDRLTWDDVAKSEVNAPDLSGVSIDVGKSPVLSARRVGGPHRGYVGAMSEAELTGEPADFPDRQQRRRAHRRGASARRDHDSAAVGGIDVE